MPLNPQGARFWLQGNHQGNQARLPPAGPDRAYFDPRERQRSAMSAGPVTNVSLRTYGETVRRPFPLPGLLANIALPH